MGISEITSKKTCTTLFLVPGLGLNLERIKNYGFINGYLDDKGGTHYTNSVYVLFKPPDWDKFQEFLVKEYGRAKNLIDDYDYEGGYVVLVYKFPEEFLPEYREFKRGKYSRFRNKYLFMLPKERSGLDKNGDPFVEASLQMRVITRSKWLIQFWEEKLEVEIGPEDELYSKPDTRGKECLDINKIKI